MRCHTCFLPSGCPSHCTFLPYLSFRYADVTFRVYFDKPLSEDEVHEVIADTDYDLSHERIRETAMTAIDVPEEKV